MQVVKIGAAPQTFFVASSNESYRKKASNRKTREERKALMKSFITQYRSLNNGSYPSLRLTHKEVGGSFYTVREILREIKQDTENSSLSFLPEEEQALFTQPEDRTTGFLQAEVLNLAISTCTSDCLIEHAQGSFVQSSHHESTAECYLTTATGKSQDEDVGKVKSCLQEIHLPDDSEGDISISSIVESDSSKEESLRGEKLIPKANKIVNSMEQKEEKQINVERAESFSPIVEGGLEEDMILTSFGSATPTLYSQGHVCSLEVEKGFEFLHEAGDLLDYGREPKEVKTGENSFICEKLENSRLAESKATDSLDPSNNHSDNGTVLSDCNGNSTVSHRKPEAAHLVNVLTGMNEVSGQAVQGHLSSALVTLAADFSDGSLEMEEPLIQNETSGPSNILPEDKINSKESITSFSSHKEGNLGLQNVISVNSDPCVTMNPGNDSVASHIKNRVENGDSQVVSSHDDGLLAQLETKQEPETAEVKHVTGGKKAGHFQNADADAFRAEAGAIIANTSNSISSNSRVPATRVLSSGGQRTVSSAWKEKEYEWTQSVRLSRSILHTHGNFPMKREELNMIRRSETKSFFVIIKAFLDAVFQILNRVMQVFTVSSKPKT